MRLFLVGSGVPALCLFCCLAQAQTPFKLDFQENGDTVQPGFTQFAGPLSQSSPYSLTFGNYTVTLTAQSDGSDLGGGFFDRNQSGGIFSPLANSGSFTYASLYNSFAYNNSSLSFASSASTSLSVSISGAGINPLTAYTMTFFSFDSDAGRQSTSGTHSVDIGGISGTTGSHLGITWSDTAPPTTNGQYSASGIFGSDASGTLTFLVTDSYSGNQDSRSGVRLNALILDTAAPSTATPEPSTLGTIASALAGGAAFSMFLRRRRQSSKN